MQRLAPMDENADSWWTPDGMRYNYYRDGAVRKPPIGLMI